jgi:hypothetical protein
MKNIASLLVVFTLTAFTHAETLLEQAKLSVDDKIPTETQELKITADKKIIQKEAGIAIIENPHLLVISSDKKVAPKKYKFAALTIKKYISGTQLSEPFSSSDLNRIDAALCKAYGYFLLKSDKSYQADPQFLKETSIDYSAGDPAAKLNNAETFASYKNGKLRIVNVTALLENAERNESNRFSGFVYKKLACSLTEEKE